jgi:hypothetical protein
MRRRDRRRGLGRWHGWQRAFARRGRPMGERWVSGHARGRPDVEPRAARVTLERDPFAAAVTAAAPTDESWQRGRREQRQRGDPAGAGQRHRRAPGRRRTTHLREHRRLTEDLYGSQIALGPEMEQLERASGGLASARERALQRHLPQLSASEITSCVHQLPPSS